jgi:hypothetical protein
VNYLAVIGIGLVAGLTGGLFGVGGGIVIVPLLIMFVHMTPQMAIGTSLAVIIPTAVMGSYRHSQIGHVDWRIAAIMAIGSVVGAYAGASLSDYVSGDWLKRAFAILLLVTAIRLLWK